MKIQLPRRRLIVAFHRWLGLFSAAFLLSLSITGLLLNHVEFFQLDRVMIRHPLILERYGMAGREAIQSYRLNEDSIISVFRGKLFFNRQPVTDAGTVLGLIEGDGMHVVATGEQLILVTPEGEWVETLGPAQLPYALLRAVGRSADDRTVLVTDTGNWIPDDAWLHFTAYEGPVTVSALKAVSLDPSEESAVLRAYQGDGVSLYRVLLDLHSGRFFGWGGRTAMDLTAVAILILILSGIGGWLRKSRNRKEDPLP